MDEPPYRQWHRQLPIEHRNAWNAHYKEYYEGPRISSEEAERLFGDDDGTPENVPCVSTRWVSTASRHVQVYERGVLGVGVPSRFERSSEHSQSGELLKPICDDFEDLPENTGRRRRCKRCFVVVVLVGW